MLAQVYRNHTAPLRNVAFPAVDSAEGSLADRESLIVNVEKHAYTSVGKNLAEIWKIKYVGIKIAR